MFPFLTQSAIKLFSGDALDIFKLVVFLDFLKHYVDEAGPNLR
ncbi:hypothetical protein [Shewanella sp. AS16]|nr:hypothetical protein [Shewanella sp. AS16]